MSDESSDMRHQRFAYTLPSEQETEPCYIENPNNFIPPMDGLYSPIAEQDPLLPYYFCQYPIIPSSADPCLSVTSIITSATNQYFIDMPLMTDPYQSLSSILNGATTAVDNPFLDIPFMQTLTDPYLSTTSVLTGVTHFENQHLDFPVLQPMVSLMGHYEEGSLVKNVFNDGTIMQNEVQNEADFYESTCQAFSNGTATACEIIGDAFQTGVNQDLINKMIANQQLKPMDQRFFTTFPVITSYGTVTILLRHLVRVDVTPHHSALIFNFPARCTAVLRGGTASHPPATCIVHPNGRILQEDIGVIHMVTGGKRAKICQRGVVFTSQEHCLAYLVDASGTKTTSEKFVDIGEETARELFFRDQKPDATEQCRKLADECMYKRYRNGDEVWRVGSFRIKQDPWGEVKVTQVTTRGEKRMVITSPTNGKVSVRSCGAEMSVSCLPQIYFSVRKGNKVVTASTRSFSAKLGTQKAGFNAMGKLVLM